MPLRGGYLYLVSYLLNSSREVLFYMPRLL
jgi:hypothetical protein